MTASCLNGRKFCQSACFSISAMQHRNHMSKVPKEPRFWTKAQPKEGSIDWQSHGDLKISLLFKCRFEGHKKFGCLDFPAQLLLMQNHNCNFMVWLSAEMQMVSACEAKAKGSFLTLTVQLFFQGLYFSSFLNQFDESFFIFIIISINCHSYSTEYSHRCYLNREIHYNVEKAEKIHTGTHHWNEYFLITL